MPPLTKPTDEKSTPLFEYNDTINQLISYAKKDLDNINNEIVLANARLAKLRQMQIDQSNEMESWKKRESIKFNNEMTSIRNETIARKNEVNLHVQQQQRITSDLQFQQGRYEGLQQQQIELKEAMVVVEGKKIQAQDMIKQAEIIKSDALTSQNNAAQLHQQVLLETEKNKQENIRLTNLNDAIERTRIKIEEDTKSFLSLKEFVEPKLRDIQTQTESMEKAKSENQQVIDELNRKVSEEKILLQSVLDKQAQLEKDTKSFLSDKEEFQRTKLFSGK